MQRIIMKSKIHNATVTTANLYYEGSISIDIDLLKEADILAGERVDVVNLNNGSRIQTYVIEAEKGSGEIALNGGAARHGHPGDKIIIISYCLLDTKEAAGFRKKIVTVNGNNKSDKK